MGLEARITSVGSRVALTSSVILGQSCDLSVLFIPCKMGKHMSLSDTHCT